MAFTHGKSTTVYSNGYDLTSYLNSVEITRSVDTAETSTFSLASKTFITGEVDSQLNFEGLYDDAASASDEILAAALTISTIWTWYPGKLSTANNSGYGFVGIQTGYNPSQTITDAVKIVGSCQGSDDIASRELGASLHVMSQETATGTGTIIDDNAGSSANGASAYLQATDVTGTAELIIEHSSNATFSADVSTLLSFTNISADHTSERIEVTGTVKRYIRASWTLDGGETLTFNVLFCRR
jgi:hypothetical protein